VKQPLKPKQIVPPIIRKSSVDIMNSPNLHKYLAKLSTYKNKKTIKDPSNRMKMPLYHKVHKYELAAGNLAASMLSPPYNNTFGHTRPFMSESQSISVTPQEMIAAA
jgi:hypothetical protein